MGVRDIVRRLARVERVHILVNDESAEKHARKVLRQAHADLAAVDFFVCRTVGWTRDFCPIFVRDESGRVVITNWQFNGWSKYPNSHAGDAVPS